MVLEKGNRKGDTMLYITGITGHSGKWFLKRLETENYTDKVRCVMRYDKTSYPEKYEIFEGIDLDIEFVIGDLADQEFLSTSLVGVDIILHIASIKLSKTIIEAAISAGVQWAILVHTTGRFSKYKSASESYIRIEDHILTKRNEIAVTVLRPTMIYGSSEDRNMYRLISFLAKYPAFPLFGKGDNLMQPVHARDLGNAYYDVLTHPHTTRNKEYDLSGKKSITYRCIIETICQYLGRKVPIITIPFGLSLAAVKAYNFMFGKRAIISVEQVLRMQEDKVFSHQKAFQDFNYTPCSFEEGIKAEVEEYLNGVRKDFSKITYQ